MQTGRVALFREKVDTRAAAGSIARKTGGRAMLRFTSCRCGIEYLVRLRREAWMKLIPTRRHYFCAKCKDTQFTPRRDAGWWLPSTKVPLMEEAPAEPGVRESRR